MLREGDATREYAAHRRLTYSTYRLARALNRAVENTALAHGISLPQLLVLQVLGEGIPLSNAQLARRTFVSSQAAHVVSGSLLDAGLLERVEHPTNRRVRLVGLSEAGRELLAACDRETEALEERLIAEVGSRAGETLRDVMERAGNVLAGGYFGDRDAEALAIARRSPTID